MTQQAHQQVYAINEFHHSKPSGPWSAPERPLRVLSWHGVHGRMDPGQNVALHTITPCFPVIGLYIVTILGVCGAPSPPPSLPSLPSSPPLPPLINASIPVRLRILLSQQPPSPLVNGDVQFIHTLFIESFSLFIRVCYSSLKPNKAASCNSRPPTYDQKSVANIFNYHTLFFFFFKLLKGWW